MAHFSFDRINMATLRRHPICPCIASHPGNKVKNCFPCPPFEIFELPCDNFQCTFSFTQNNYRRIWANNRSLRVSRALGVERRLFSGPIGTNKGRNCANAARIRNVFDNGTR